MSPIKNLFKKRIIFSILLTVFCLVPQIGRALDTKDSAQNYRIKAIDYLDRALVGKIRQDVYSNSFFSNNTTISGLSSTQSSTTNLLGTALPFSGYGSYESEELEIDEKIAEAYSFETGQDTPTLRKLLAIHISVFLRRNLGNTSFITSIQSLQNNNECKSDLALDRHIVRLAQAKLNKNEAERLTTLMEFNSSLHCLSSNQAKDFADKLGISVFNAIGSLASQLGNTTTSKIAIGKQLSNFINPLLLTSDIAKGLATNWSYIVAKMANNWSDRGFYFQNIIYLYDWHDGVLLDVSDAINKSAIDKILDPINIGLGTCSFTEMLNGGSNSGSFKCDRGLSCANATSNFGGLFDRESSAFGEFGRITSGGLSFNSGFDGKEDKLSKLGVPISDLEDGCTGNGGAGSNSGSLGGASSFNLGKCIMQGAIATSRANDPYYCMLSANLEGARKTEQVIAGVDPVTGAPIAVGVYGNEECFEDSVAQTNSKKKKNNPSLSKEAALEQAKKLTWGFYQNSEVQDFIHNLTKDTLKESVKGASDFNKKSQDIDNLNQEDILNKALEALGHTSDKDLGGIYGKTFGYGKTFRIQVDVDKHTDNGKIDIYELADTVLHEFIHLYMDIAATKARISPKPSQDLHHKYINSDEADTMFNTMSPFGRFLVDFYLGDVNDDNSEKDKDDSGYGANNERPGGEKQQPNPDEDCTAMTNIMKDYLSCHGWSDVGIEGGTPGEQPPLPEEVFDCASQNCGAVDPPREDDNPGPGRSLNPCLEQFGVVAGTTGNGGLITLHTTTKDLLTESSLELCGRIQCSHEAQVAKVGDACGCANSVNLSLLRDVNLDKLCNTSNACVPNPVDDLG